MKHMEKIISLRQQGKSYRQIAKELQCSKGTISFHCKKLPDHALSVKNNTLKTHKHKQTVIRWTESIKKKIFTLYDYGILTTEIADIMSLDIEAVRIYCRTLPRHDYKSLSNYEKVKRRRRKIKILSVIFKGGKCIRCGYNKNVNVLEFHHKNPALKDFTIAEHSNNAWSRIKKELIKCDILCATCHREIHANDKAVEEVMNSFWGA